MKQLRIPGVAGVMLGKLICDMFCAAGGASKGLARGLGRSPDIAINHDAEAVRYHELNHPETRHYRGDVFEVDPRQATRGQAVGWLHASPDCTYFSKAKGAAPLRDRERRIRSLAWVIVRWAAITRAEVISLENVEEILGWGPVRRGRPVKKHRGKYFRLFVEQLRSLGYVVDWRVLNAADYGAATSRERLFLLARCDGQPIVWPKPTHGAGTRRRHRAASEIIDWSLPVLSIFDRKKPLAEDTQVRLAKGAMRFVVNDPRPFIAPLPMSAVDRSALVAAFIAKHYTGVVGMKPTKPLGTITTRDHHALVACHLTKFYGTSVGASVREPLPTITAGGNHLGLVAAWLTKYYGGAVGQPLTEPLHTITTVARFGLVTATIRGEPYVLTDIGMRMLQPRELAAAQGFDASYILPASKKLATHFIGNSVAPDVMAAIARANAPVQQAIGAQA